MSRGVARTLWVTAYLLATTYLTYNVVRLFVAPRSWEENGVWTDRVTAIIVLGIALALGAEAVRRHIRDRHRAESAD